jgi:serine/threonine protein kinase
MLIDPTMFEGMVIDGHIQIRAFEDEGAFSFVFNAWDDNLRREVAIKILKPGILDPSALVEFINEGVLLEKCTDSTNVVDLIGAVDRKSTLHASVTGADGLARAFDQDFQYLELEWMDGALSGLLAHLNDIEWHDRLRLVRDVVKGLHQMHLKDVFHRDIKSNNALVRAGKGSSFEVKVADLGRSRHVRSSPKGAPESYTFGRGNRMYSPPECLWGLGEENGVAAFRRADLYLAGSVLFEMAVGLAITPVAIPNPQDIVAMARLIPIAERRKQYEANANILRAQYASAFTMFEEKLPPIIRHDGGRLLRQLCDPRPDRREPDLQRHQGHPQPGLNWLLARLDILIRRCQPRGVAMSTLKKRDAAS